MKQRSTLILFLSLFIWSAQAQMVLDDFNDGVTTGWTLSTGNFNTWMLSEANGEMRIDYDNNFADEFPRAVLTFPSAMDFSTFSIMRVRLRTENQSGLINLRVDLKDTNTYPTNGVPFVLSPVFDDGLEKIYEFDFAGKWFATYWDGCACSGFWQVDSSQITNLEFFIGYGLGYPASQDSVWIQSIEMDTVSIGPCPAVTPDPNILDDFYCQQNINYTFAEGFLQSATNPDQSGINTDLVVGEYTRNSNNTDAFGGTFELGPLDFSIDNQMKMDFYNIHAPLNFLIVLQDGNGNDISTKSDSSKVLNAWETLNFDFSDLTDSTDISRIVLLIDPGNTGIGTNKYYMDNLRMQGFQGNPCDTVMANANIIDDFDCHQNLDYQFVEGFLQPVANPDSSAANPSPTVGEYTRNPNNSDAWGGNFDFAPLDFVSNNQIKMEFWNNNAPTNIIMVLQDSNGNDIHTATSDADSTASWETINFDFSFITGNPDVSRIVLLIGAGDTTLGGNVYYYDNLRLDGLAATPCAGVVPANDTLEDFDCQQNITYSFVEGFLQAIPNPDMSGINQSATVGEYTRNPNVSDAWGGPLNLGPIDFSQNNQLKLHFWNNNGPTNFIIVMQDGAGNDLHTATAQSASTGAWEELSFDFAPLTNATDVGNIVLLIGAGDNTLGGNIYYLDNIRLEGFVADPCSGVTPDPNIMEDFDCQRNLDYQFTEGFLEVVPNPDMSGVNTSLTVGKYTRNNTNADAFGGDFTLAPLDFSQNNQIKMDVWDTNLPSTVICVLQDGSGNDLGNRTVSTTVGNAWETLNFDFGFLPGNADVSKVVLLFDAGSIADSNNIYYFDNLRLDGALSVNDPGIVKGLQIDQIYPNPVSDQLTLDYALESPSDVRVEVVGVDGSLVFETLIETAGLGKNSSTIDVQSLANGVYTIVVKTSFGTAVSKFVRIN